MTICPSCYGMFFDRAHILASCPCRTTSGKHWVVDVCSDMGRRLVNLLEKRHDRPHDRP
jgi:hypothetical protein